MQWRFWWASKQKGENIYIYACKIAIAGRFEILFSLFVYLFSVFGRLLKHTDWQRPDKASDFALCCKTRFTLTDSYYYNGEMKTQQFDFSRVFSNCCESYRQTRNVYNVIYILFISIKSFYSMIFFLSLNYLLLYWWEFRPKLSLTDTLGSRDLLIRQQCLSVNNNSVFWHPFTLTSLGGGNAVLLNGGISKVCFLKWRSLKTPCQILGKFWPDVITTHGPGYSPYFG